MADAPGSLTADVSGIASANSPAAAPAAGSAPSSAASPTAPASSEPAAAAEPSSRVGAYEGSEPSLLQETATKEPPKVDAKPAGADAGKKDAATAPDANAPSKAGEAAKPEGDAAKLAKAAEVPKDGDKPAEPAKADAPASVEYKYELPPAIKLDDARKTELHGVLDKFRSDPTNVQPLVDFYNTSISEFTTAQTKQIEQHNRNVFNEMRAENRKAIMADPVIGGSGFQTTQGAVARMRDMLIPKEMLEPRKFDDGKPRLSVADEFLESTGAGDHPVLWHILHNAARYLDEPQANKMPPNPRPAPNNGKKPGRGKLRELYTHSSSNK